MRRLNNLQSLRCRSWGAAVLTKLTRRLGLIRRAQRGSASIEFLGLGIVILCPIAYGVLALVQLEQAALATESAARNSARVLSVQAVDGSSSELANEHIQRALENHGIAIDRAHVTVRCSPDADCKTMGETLTVTVRVDTPVPLVGLLNDDWRIPVESSATFPRSPSTQVQS